MQIHQIVTAILSSLSKTEQPLINPQKIKSILTKKLSAKIHNSERLLQQFDDQILYQIEKTESEILKERQRQDKIKTVQERELKTRSLLSEKIKSKLQKSLKKKKSQDKEKLQNKIRARKLKEQFFQQRKQKIQQSQFKKRLQIFKQINAENNPKTQTFIQEKSSINQNSPLRRTFSVRSTLQDAIQRSKQIEQIQYFKKMQSLEKRKIYQKPERIFSVTQPIDKKQLIEFLKSESENKMIQKLGLDLTKIQQARLKKQKSVKQIIEKLKQKAEFKQEQRGYRVQILKKDINDKLRSQKQVLSQKNQRFLTMRNKSTPQLNKNWSSISQNRDSFGMSSTGNFFEPLSKMSRTLQNFRQSMNASVQKAEEYLEKEKQQKVKKDVINQIQKIIREEKVEILMK